MPDKIKPKRRRRRQQHIVVLDDLSEANQSFHHQVLTEISFALRAITEPKSNGKTTQKK